MSSPFPLRLPPHLMEDVKTLSEERRVSINQFLIALVAERVGEIKATRMVEERAARADVAKARAALDRAKERPRSGNPLPEWDLLDDPPTGARTGRGTGQGPSERAGSPRSGTASG